MYYLKRIAACSRMLGGVVAGMFLVSEAHKFYVPTEVRVVELSAMNWAEVPLIVPSFRDTVILPVGALEPHGIMNNGADNTIVAALAKEIGPPTNAVVAPLIPYGVVKRLKEYPGSCSIPDKTFEQYVASVVEGLNDAGFRIIIILNGHGEQSVCLERVATGGTKANQAYVTLINWWAYSTDITQHFFGNLGGHAANDETAMVQAIEPGLLKNEWESVLWKKAMRIDGLPPVVARPANEYGKLEVDRAIAKEYKLKVVERLVKIIQKIQNDARTTFHF